MEQQEIIILDSSFLISLAKIDALSLLEVFKKKAGVTLLVPYAIYKECVEDGIRGGYLDSLAIKKQIERGTVSMRDVDLPSELAVDEVLMVSAAHWGVKTVFVDDQLLLKKVARKGVIVKRSVEFLRDLVKKGDLNRSDYLKFLNRLIKRRRLSEDKRTLYEEVEDENLDYSTS